MNGYSSFQSCFPAIIHSIENIFYLIKYIPVSHQVPIWGISLQTPLSNQSASLHLRPISSFSLWVHFLLLLREYQLKNLKKHVWTLVSLCGDGWRIQSATTFFPILWLQEHKGQLKEQSTLSNFTTKKRKSWYKLYIN